MGFKDALGVNFRPALLLQWWNEQIGSTKNKGLSLKYTSFSDVPKFKYAPRKDKRVETSLPSIKPPISPAPVMTTMRELTDYLDTNRKSATPDLLETGDIHRLVSKCIHNIS